MTDEQLHDMMADPGPPPTYDEYGWPTDLCVFRPGDRVITADGDWATVVEPGMRVAVASDVPNTGTYWADPASLRHLDRPCHRPTNSAGPAATPCKLRPGDRVQRREHEWGTVTAVWPAVFLADVVWDGNEPAVETVPLADLHRTPDSAGPAPSGGLGTHQVVIAAGNTGFEFVQLMDLLVATAQAATKRATAIAEELEGRRRELWDAVVYSARCAEHPGGLPSKGFAEKAATYAAAYGLISGISPSTIDKLLAAELDARYGPDRQRTGGGEPRG